MSHKTIYGYVKADGTINSGGGFSVEHDGANAKGVYYIKFSQAFSEAPAVNVTIQCDPDDYHSSWWVNPLVLYLDESKCEIVIVASNFTTKYNSNFSFTAVGSTG